MWQISFQTKAIDLCITSKDSMKNWMYIVYSKVFWYIEKPTGKISNKRTFLEQTSKADEKFHRLIIGLIWAVKGLRSLWWSKEVLGLNLFVQYRLQKRKRTQKFIRQGRRPEMTLEFKPKTNPFWVYKEDKTFYQKKWKKLFKAFKNYVSKKKEQMKKVRLQVEVCRQGFHFDAKHLIRPITKAVIKTS